VTPFLPKRRAPQLEQLFSAEYFKGIFSSELKTFSREENLSDRLLHDTFVKKHVKLCTVTTVLAVLRDGITTKRPFTNRPFTNSPFTENYFTRHPFTKRPVYKNSFLQNFLFEHRASKFAKSLNM
jgi:hypothetical protein